MHRAFHKALVSIDNVLGELLLAVNVIYVYDSSLDAHFCTSPIFIRFLIVVAFETLATIKWVLDPIIIRATQSS